MTNHNNHDLQQEIYNLKLQIKTINKTLLLQKENFNLLKQKVDILKTSLSETIKIILGK